MIDIQSTDFRILVTSCLTSTFVITLRYDIFSKERQNCSPVLGGSLDGEPKPILPIEKVRRKGLRPGTASFATYFLLQIPNFS